MSNEDKILAILEEHSEALAKQGRILEEHGKLLVSLYNDVSTLKKDMSDLKEDVADLRTTVTRVALIQENEVLPRIRLLAEGHQTLLETMAPLDRVEALEEDVAFLKGIVAAR